MIAAAGRTCTLCCTFKPACEFSWNTKAGGRKALKSRCKACVNLAEKARKRRFSIPAGGRDDRDHTHAARAASAVHGKRLSPNWVRRACLLARLGRTYVEKTGAAR